MQDIRHIKLQPLSGFPEHLPAEQLAFERVRARIEAAYRRCGFVPLETPAVERWQVLTAKGGIQKQVFSVGRPRERAAPQLDMFDALNPEMGLRFDLTVPLARYVVQHASNLTFPFRRYQIQPVWRGERPQRGRFRQFYQADIDVVGRSRLDILYDAEVLAVTSEALAAIECLPGFALHVSSRRILSGLLADFGIAEYADELLRQIDKASRDGLDSMLDKVRELVPGRPTGFMKTLSELMRSTGASVEYIRGILKDRTQALAGLAKLEVVYNAALRLGVQTDRLVLDTGIVRGLDYYTGTVFETFVRGNADWGSIASGGRYDDLAGVFGAQRFPGVGGSIGLSRLVDLLLSNNLLAAETATPASVLITVLEREQFMGEYLAIAAELRSSGIGCEVFLQPARLGEQLGYADRMGFCLAVIAGGAEFNNGAVKVKDIRRRQEQTVPRAELVAFVRRCLPAAGGATEWRNAP